MMEAHFFVIIDMWGKCRHSTASLNAGNDGTTSGLPQGLGQGTEKIAKKVLADGLMDR